MATLEKRKTKNSKVIFDANTLMRGVIHPRFAFEILNHAFREDFQLFLLPYTIKEAVKNIAKKFPDRLDVLEKFLVQCPYQTLENPPIVELEKQQDLVVHHNDLPLAVAAVKSGMDYLVSNDKHFTANDETTKQLHAKLPCLTAGNFLKKVMGWTSEELEIIQRRKFENVTSQFWE